tara:strand:+ start:404 stop:793 length:390 start_codon:yes stop_codon:yes gene_type:complete
MNVYQTDIDGVFVGITVADQDPLDDTNWLIPAGCVETAPPTVDDSQFAKWDGAKWDVEDTPIVEPEPEPEPIAPEVLVRAERDSRLAASDTMALADRITDAWRTYRQALRNVPAQAGFPTDVTWPIEPI